MNTNNLDNSEILLLKKEFNTNEDDGLENLPIPNPEIYSQILHSITDDEIENLSILQKKKLFESNIILIKKIIDLNDKLIFNLIGICD